MGSNCYDHHHSKSDFSVSLSILSKFGEFLFSTLVSHVFPFAKAEEAFKTAGNKREDKAVKVVIDIESV